METSHFFKLKPVSILVFMSAVNVIIYIDRGALSAVVPLLESSDGLNLTSIEAGAIGSVFMLGYMLSSPLFAYSAQFMHPLYLMAIGLIIWAAAVLSISLVDDFWILALSRSFTGIGEASFVSLAPPYILETAPSTHKSL